MYQAGLVARNSTYRLDLFHAEAHPRSRSGLDRHSSLRAEHLSEPPNTFIMSGVAISASKAVQFSFWIFSTISSRQRNRRLPKWLPFCGRRWQSRHNLSLPKPCGRTTVRAHLVSVPCIHTQPHCQVDGFVKLGVLHLLEKPTRFSRHTWA